MPKETLEEKRRRFLETAKASISNAYAGEEHSIIQAINAYNEAEKVRGILYERLEEWYSMYFPEAKVNNRATFSRMITTIGANKKKATEEQLTAIFGDKAGSMRDQISRSIGREPGAEEFESIKMLAEAESSLDRLQVKMDAYLAKSVKKVMPNISYLIEYKIAAELLAKAGSMQRLSTMPASTIQLLGAEKALFKHIKFGTKAPKYGVLFKLPQIGNANRRVRGRLARIYATKISIASRADAISKRFIADKLKVHLDEACKKVYKAK